MGKIGEAASFVGRFRGWLLWVVIAAVVVISPILLCGGAPPTGPQPGTEIVDGEGNWKLAVFSEPVYRGSIVGAWAINEEIECCTEVIVDFELSGETIQSAEYLVGGDEYAVAHLKNSCRGGVYDVIVTDSATGDLLGRAQFEIRADGPILQLPATEPCDE